MGWAKRIGRGRRPAKPHDAAAAALHTESEQPATEAMNRDVDAESLQQQQPEESAPAPQHTPPRQAAFDSHNDALFYTGGVMEVDKMKQQQSPSRFSRVTSWITQSSSKDDNDTSFDEWTPPDSSYGAAIPVGGWIPKHIRRSIEATLILALILAFVYLVVSVSMMISEDAHRKSGNRTNATSNTYLDLDDDLYVPYNSNGGDDDAYATDDAYQAANDDNGGGAYYNYYQENNNNYGGNRYRRR